MNATYVYGTAEYLVIEIEATRAGTTFDPTGRAIELAICPVGTPFDPSTATWATGDFETVADRVYAKAVLGAAGLAYARGAYQPYARIVGGDEGPILVKVAGIATVE